MSRFLEKLGVQVNDAARRFGNKVFEDATGLRPGRDQAEIGHRVAAGETLQRLQREQLHSRLPERPSGLLSWLRRK